LRKDHARASDIGGFSSQSVADYEPIAWFCQKHWCQQYHPGALAVRPERFLLSHLPAAAKLLDVCCGTGTLDRSAPSTAGTRRSHMARSIALLCLAMLALERSSSELVHS
jgi:hypothetical protein